MKEFWIRIATQTDDDYIAKVASGRVVALTDSEWHYSQCETALMADGKVDQTYVGLPVTLREDQVCKALLYQGTTVGYGMAITKSCEDPVRAIKFMDYLCSDEGQIYIIGELKEKIISWTKMESRIVPMKKLPKHSQIQTIIRTQVLITILDFQSMEQVLTLRTDSRILQRRKNL